jgi:glycosyltransferase involved in cell wall biosynthesis
MALIERRILRNAAIVHFTSAIEQREAESLGVAMRGIVIPLAVEPMTPVSGAKLANRFPMLQDQRCILYLSRLDPKKNVEGLLAAIRLCSDSLPDTCWLIAGAGAPEYMAQLHDMALQLGVGARLIWAGHLDGELKAAAFARADMFVLPSFSENFGIAAAEALAAGLPCLLGHGVAITEDLVHAGAALAVGTEPADIADAMIRLAKDDVLREKMSVNAKAFALQNYSVSSMGLALVKLYSEVLSKGNAKAAA